LTDEALLDTDLLLKTVSYRLAGDTFNLLEERGLTPKVLGAARFMLRTLVGRGRKISDKAAAAAELTSVEPLLLEVEPTDLETALSAEIEILASSGGHAVDGGESQLLAMLICRSSRILLTGDKRAIRGLAQMLSPLPPNRIVCLEQLLTSLADAKGPLAIRGAVCSEPDVDKAVTAACSCSAPGDPDPREGLASYTEDLRRAAPSLLSEGTGLPA
jgi:hypothetical protein